MKTKLVLCFLSAFVLIMSCSKTSDSPSENNENNNNNNNNNPGSETNSVNISRNNFQVDMALNATDTFSVKSTIQWAASITAGSNWLKIDKTSGAAGTTVVTATALSNNETGATRTATITITADKIQPITITVTQKPFPTVIGWQKVIGGFYKEEARSIAKTSDGGFLAAGYTYGNNTGDITGSHGVEDALIVKVNANGAKQWVKSYGGSGIDEANAIAATPDGNFIVAGKTASSNGDVPGIKGASDLWVFKIDASGSILWSKTFGSNLTDFGSALVVNADGSIVIAGTSTGDNNGDIPANHGMSFEYWLIKLDASGNKLWSKTYGGTGVEEALAITACSDGGYAVTGHASSIDGDVTGNHKEYNGDIWVLKVDASGTKQWNKCFGGLNDDWGRSIKVTADGGFIVAGYTRSIDGDVLGGNHGDANDAWLIKLDASGTKQWSKTYGGTNVEEANAIMPTADGGYVFAGYANSMDGDVTGHHFGDYDFWIAKVNANGNLEWNKCYGSSGLDIAYALIGTDDNGYLLGGFILKSDEEVKDPVNGDRDLWLLKVKPI